MSFSSSDESDCRKQSIAVGGHTQNAEMQRRIQAVLDKVRDENSLEIYELSARYGDNEEELMERFCELTENHFKSLVSFDKSNRFHRYFPQNYFLHLDIR